MFISGHLHTFEPWVKQVKWGSRENSAKLKCISLDDNEDYCNDTPCKNDGNGICYNGLSDYYCDCKCGWKGKDCNTSKPSYMNTIGILCLIKISFQETKYNLIVN